MKIVIGIQEVFMSDNEQQLVFLVDFLDLLSQHLAPLKPLAVLGVWVLLPEWRNLIWAEMIAPTPWVFFQGAILGIFWHVLGDVSQHDTTVGCNFRLDALVKPPT